MLNFAKAELVDTNERDIVNQRIGHGLSFNPVSARTVAGDTLTINSGVFPLLYRRRTGHRIPARTRLPVKSLLCLIPEISGQVESSGIADPSFTSVDFLTVMDDKECWIVLRIDPTPFMTKPSSTVSLIKRHFHEVQPLQNWREMYAISLRLPRKPPRFYESKATIRLSADGSYTFADVNRLIGPLNDVLYVPGFGDSDAYIAPYLYKSSATVMPPALARYAVTFYASSLVRYRPAAFDANQFPEQAYLFDSIARECAVPMLIDVLTAIEGQQQLFFPQGSLRR